MAKLRMTYKNLKALRKSKEYQAMLVDLVSVGVVPKATAEGLLGYNIPANLITDDESSGTDDPPIVDPGTGGEGSGIEQGSGTEQGSGDTPTPIIVPVKVSVDSGEPITVGTYTIPSSWETIDYGLTHDVDEYVFGSNFTSNENWSSDYDYGASSIYYAAESPDFRDTNGDQISWETIPSELPEGAFIAVVLASASSSSSS